MTVIVISGRVYTGEREYFPGETIAGLNKKDEESLVKSGACRYPEEGSEQPEAHIFEDLPEGITNLGKGKYILSDGTEVKGKAKAIEAQNAINSQVKDDEDVGDDDEDEDEDPDGEESGPSTGIPGVE